MLLTASAFAVRRIRAYALPRTATRAEIQVAIIGMEEGSLQALAKNILPESEVNRQWDLDRSTFIQSLLWASDLRALEAAIRRRDRDALPNQDPALVKHALAAYFSQQERRRIAIEMKIPLACNLFRRAKSTNRLAELEKRMRAIHPAVF